MGELGPAAVEYRKKRTEQVRSRYAGDAINFFTESRGVAISPVVVIATESQPCVIITESSECVCVIIAESGLCVWNSARGH